ncbi:inositol monophosphatase family protein [Paractinoplanes rishiriensis]|uniref:Histidinol-phosphatase n=1 Tax=Paractinoplanes rishiriensis TaxID=1050105 RepID=A0A919MWC9_9ACTN|nr:inositol monophosphatase [Actinoplanes rishiriensis]GIE97329.1 histidinol-phosphatase [Actinoplanes rishiriensis]
MESDLQLAQRAVLTGAAVALPHFAALAELPTELKADGSVVTAADRAVETAIRDVLAAGRPHDAVLGEEHGETSGPDASRRWIVDPIDGTALFVAGDERWLILLALEEDGEIVLGVAAHPAQGSIWWATRGGGAFEGRVIGGRVVAGTSIRVGPAGSDEVAGSRFSAVPADWAPELVRPVEALTPKLPWDVHPALMVARGDLDIALQTGGQIWDFAPTSLIVTEAGGSYSRLDGTPRPGPGASIYARGDAIRRRALETIGALHPL